MGSFSSATTAHGTVRCVPIETLFLDTIDGLHLEADVLVPANPRGAVTIAHPHPQFGGNRHSPVVSAMFDALAMAGFAVVRFDFRGVGASEGSYGGGVDERLDVAAAVDLIAPYAFDGPLIAAGYSFGALTALQVDDVRITGWAAVAPPLAASPVDPLAASDHRPKLLVVPDHDQFTPSHVVLERTASWRATDVVQVEVADHFLAGRTAQAAREVVDWVSRLAGR
jgi:uncharacterized protein